MDVTKQERPRVLVFDTVRTPRGRGRSTGSLHGVKPVDLATGLVRELRHRNPGLDTEEIDDVVLGCVTPLGDQGANIAKVVASLAGLPDSVPGIQINRFCASGLEAVNQATARILAGTESLIIAGGVESMSRVKMGRDGGAVMNDPRSGLATHFIPQGVSADLLATIEGWTRSEVDGFAVESHRRAARAQAEGRFDHSLVPVTDVNGVTVLDRDEHVRADTTLESLSRLPLSFQQLGEEVGFDSVALDKYPSVAAIDHVHHAGNSSGLVDGAAMVLVGSEEAGVRNGLTPRARIVSYAVTATDPTIMLTGPGAASRIALDRAGLTIADIDLIEINEAFSSVALRLMRDLGNYPHNLTNVNGGAIALGHPLGATGAIILGTLIDELHARDQRFGLATLCAGGGIGIATIVERLA